MCVSARLADLTRIKVVTSPLIKARWEPKAMISTFSTMIRCSPVRAEMKALGLGSNRAPLLGLGFTFLAVVDVLAASIALAGS